MESPGSNLQPLLPKQLRAEPVQEYRCDSCNTEFLTAGTGRRQWDPSIDELTWQARGITFPRASFAVAQDYVIRQVHRYWGIRLRKVSQGGNILSLSGPIDGPNRVLARQRLPEFPSFANEQLRGTWDRAENPSQRLLNKYTAHEICHAFGFDHNDSVSSLLNSSVRDDDEHYEDWDPWTINQGVIRYGRGDGRTPQPSPGNTCLEMLGLAIVNALCPDRSEQDAWGIPVAGSDQHFER